MTFGYNSELFNGPTTVSIMDFARDLLFNLRYSTGDGGHALHIGDVCITSPSIRLKIADPLKVPLVFVAHSMGGLVVKEVGYVF